MKLVVMGLACRRASAVGLALGGRFSSRDQADDFRESKNGTGRGVTASDAWLSHRRLISRKCLSASVGAVCPDRQLCVAIEKKAPRDHGGLSHKPKSNAYASRCGKSLKEIRDLPSNKPKPKGSAWQAARS